MVEVLFIGDEHVRKFMDEQTDGGRVAPLSFMLAWVGGGLWTCLVFGWIGFAVLFIATLILHLSGMIIKIGDFKVHSVTVLNGIAWFYGAMSGYSFFVGKYLSFPEFLMKEGVFTWLFAHGFAFTVLFIANLLLTYVDENYNTVTIIIEPLEYLLAVFCVSAFVHLLWIPFFYYTICWLVDWIVSRGRDGIYGGAGMFDALVIKPLALEGLAFFIIGMLHQTPTFSPVGNIVMMDNMRILFETP